MMSYRKNLGGQDTGLGQAFEAAPVVVVCG
jgi:hypothetical protein